MSQLSLTIIEEPKRDALDEVVVGKPVRIELSFADPFKLRADARRILALMEEITVNMDQIIAMPAGSPRYQSERRKAMFYAKFRTALLAKELRRKKKSTRSSQPQQEEGES